MYRCKRARHWLSWALWMKHANDRIGTFHCNNRIYIWDDLIELLWKFYTESKRPSSGLIIMCAHYDDTTKKMTSLANRHCERKKKLFEEVNITKVLGTFKNKILSGLWWREKKEWYFHVITKFVEQIFDRQTSAESIEEEMKENPARTQYSESEIDKSRPFSCIIIPSIKKLIWLWRSQLRSTAPINPSHPSCDRQSINETNAVAVAAIMWLCHNVIVCI
jgi:hypothetical protein